MAIDQDPPRYGGSQPQVKDVLKRGEDVLAGADEVFKRGDEEDSVWYINKANISIANFDKFAGNWDGAIFHYNEVLRWLDSKMNEIEMEMQYCMAQSGKEEMMELDPPEQSN